MDLAAILADAKIIATLAQLAIQVGMDSAPFVVRLYNILVKGETLSDQERAEMLATEASLRARLQAPLPPDDGTTTT